MTKENPKSIPPVKVNREDLLRRLDQVQVGLSPRELVEQSNCFAFQGGEVFTFNEETACRAASGLPKAFRGAVPAAPMLKILKKLPEEEVTIKFNKGELVVTGNRRGVGLKMESEVTLPIESVETPKEKDWKGLHEDFADAVTIVKECAGKEEKAKCVHITPKYMEACDTVQITRYMIETGLKESVLINKDSIQHVPALDMTEFAETDSWLHFRSPSGLVLSCLKTVDEYPDLGQYLSVKGSPAVLPKGLADAIDKAEVFSSEDRDNNKVIVELRRGKIRVKSAGVTGRYWEVKDVKYGGEPMGFMVSPKLMVEIVRRHTKCVIGTGKGGEKKGRRLMVNGGKFVFIACLEEM